MSRIFWVGVGAIGGVVAYRKGQRSVERAKERGVLGNLQLAAETTSTIATGVAKVVALGAASVTEQNHDAPALRAVESTPIVRAPISRRQAHPATARRFDALAPVVDVRDIRSGRVG